MELSGAAGARLGLVGLGRMGARLAEAAVAAGARVVCAYDTDPAPFALSVHPELAPVLTGDPSVFWATPCDALLIATTAPAHVPLLLTGLERGIRRFVVEKPFCTGLDEGRQAMRVADACGARVVVNHGRRYCPNYATLDALDGSSELGALRGISVSVGAAGLGCMGVHYLDLFIRAFGGPPERVFAHGDGRPPDNPRGSQFHDPGACALMIWPDGRRAFLEVADDTGIPPIIEFRYTHGRVLIENEMTPWQVRHRAEGDRALPLTRYGQPTPARPLTPFTPFGLIDMATAAIHDACGEGTVRSDGHQALMSIELFAAIREAADSGEPVRLPLGDAAAGRRFAIP